MSFIQDEDPPSVVAAILIVALALLVTAFIWLHPITGVVR